MRAIQNRGTLISAWKCHGNLLLLSWAAVEKKQQHAACTWCLQYSSDAQAGLCELCARTLTCATVISNLLVICINFSCVSWINKRLFKNDDGKKKRKFHQMPPNIYVVDFWDIFLCNFLHMFTVSVSNKTPHLVFWYTMHTVVNSFNKAYCSNKSLLYIPE